jgi:hypothetical protein
MRRAWMGDVDFHDIRIEPLTSDQSMMVESSKYVRSGAN